MDISSTSNSSYTRPVTPSKSSSDRRSDDSQVALVEAKAQEKAQQQQAAQEKLQQNREESERRLDGRLINFGYEKNDSENQNQSSVNRSRVNDAYSSRQNETTYSKLTNLLKKSKIKIDRKILANLAEHHPEIFSQIITLL